jgi:2-polyprenyl-3-methyl-5-hydroxy-6-metoxy-1,4-benzoquinol methylase
MEKDGFDEYRCPICNLSFVSPQPEAVWLKDKVYSYESGYQGNKKTDLSLIVEDSRSRKILDFLEKEKPEGSLLDVGCSSGQFMYWASKRGFSCSGVEINKRTADIAISNGYKVHNGFLDDAPFERQSFDVVFLGDVIEHVNDPRKFIEDVRMFLKADGLIVISTPNVDCFWSHATLTLYKLFNIPWTSATPPHHLTQFSLSNLDMLMKGFGFKNTKSFFDLPPSLKYELGALHLFKRYKQNKNVKNLLFMVFSFGLYIVVYILNYLLHLLLKRDFHMSVVYSLDK